MNKKEDLVNNLHFAVLAADVVLFTFHDRHLWVRMIPVHRPPYFPDHQAMPGGLVHPTETAEQSAVRLLADKAGVTSPVYLEQLATFSRIDRDPRDRVVAVAYLALAPWNELSEAERADTPQSWWARPSSLRGLAYDHDEMLAVALDRLSARTSYTTILSKLMPSEFTLTELEQAYEIVLGRRLDKRNFRKKVERLNILKALNRQRRGQKARPAELYAFARTKVVGIEAL